MRKTSFQVAALLLTLLLPPVCAQGARAAEAGLQALSDSEMDQLHGGFATASGLEISFGIDLSASATPLSRDMGADANAQLNLAASATLGHINGGPQILNLIQYSPMGSVMVLQNSLNNVTLEQMTQLNVDVTNYSQIHSQLVSLSQSLGDLVTGLPR